MVPPVAWMHLEGVEGKKVGPHRVHCCRGLGGGNAQFCCPLRVPAVTLSCRFARSPLGKLGHGTRVLFNTSHDCVGICNDLDVKRLAFKLYLWD